MVLGVLRSINLDVLTHTVAGTALAATALRGRERSPGYDLGLLFGAVAGVFPDVDELFRPFGPELHGLSYAVYHRGWTHTIAGCLLTALGLLVLALLFAKKRPPAAWLFAIALGASLLHVLMDATNDYGVHPFWPFENRWIYGDFIFLAEPLVIGSLLPLALSGFLRDRGSRVINMRLLGIAVLLVISMLSLYCYRVYQGKWFTPFTATLASGWIIGQLVAACAFERRQIIGWSSLLVVWSTFWVGSVIAKHAAGSALARAGVHADVIQLDATPAPANPFCWRLVAVAVDKEQIVEWMGIASLWPDVFPAQSCRTATPLGPPTFVSDDGFKTDLIDDPEHPGRKVVREHAPSNWVWLGRFSTRRSTLEQVTRTNCLAAAHYEQLRAPILQKHDCKWVLGDVRLDYELALDEYSKYAFPLDATPHCDFCPVRWRSPTFEALEQSASH